MTPFSLDTAEKIFRDYPAWRRFAREEDDSIGGRYVVVEVSAPIEANVQLGLVISTDNDEVTVSFDHYHAHFDEWSSEESRAQQFSALAFVQAIMSETVAVASWWWGDKWRGSSLQPAGTAAEPAHISGFNRIRVRSWKGTFNEDLDA